jgi:hypothetical protein
MWKRWALGAVILVLAGPATGQDTAALDKLLCDALKEMHNKAADLYNGGDPNGCYRVFQGGLHTARPLLTHRPDVQRLIDDGMAAAERMASVPLRARQLHDTIEAVRTKLKPAKTADVGTPPAAPMPPVAPAPTPPPPAAPSLPMNPIGTPPAPPVAVTDTLWKRLGGEDGVNKIVDDWITWALVDPKIDFTRGGKIKLDKMKEAELKQRFVAFLSAITPGGTVVPTSTRTMADVHKDMAITGPQFEAFVGQLKSALEKNNVTARDVDEVLKRVNETRKDIVPGA